MNARIRLRLPFVVEVNGKRITLENYKKIIHLTRDTVLIDGWLFNHDYGMLYLSELNDWEKDYNLIDFNKKVVLDIGAGCGETAKFFLEKGAESVICIEPYEIPYRYLEINSKKHNIIPKKMAFTPEILKKFQFDFVKIDIEGFEATLIESDFLKNFEMPIVIEVHTGYLIEKFLNSKFKIIRNIQTNPSGIMHSILCKNII